MPRKFSKTLLEIFQEELKTRTSFFFPSESGLPVEYCLWWSQEDGTWKCNCPGFVAAKRSGGLCKHAKWRYKWLYGHPVENYYGKPKTGISKKRTRKTSD